MFLAILPYALAAAAVAPAAMIVTALILAESKRPIVGAWLFVAGAAVLDVVFAAVVLAVLQAAGVTDHSGNAGEIIDIVLGLAFLVIGVHALVAKPSPERDEARRAQVDRLARAGFATLLGAGVVVQIINSDALAAFAGGLKEMAEADAGPGAVALAVLVFLAIMLIPYYGPIVLYLVDRERAGGILRGASQWLLRHAQPVEVVTGLVLGALFLGKGLAGLS